MYADVIAEAERNARLLLGRYAVRGPADIHIEAWAHALGIELVEAPLDGAQGQLIRLGDVVQIVLPERITDRRVRRFIIAHEMDHFLRKDPSPAPTMMCTPKTLRRGDESMHAFEIRANAFAGAILLPDSLLRRRCEVSPVSLDVPHQIANEYDVSILTSTIRFTGLSSERCAAIFSKDGRVQWVAASRTFTREIERGTLLSSDSLAMEFFTRRKLDNRPGYVPADAWFRTSTEVDILEHSICSHEHGTVLSLIWVPEAVAACLGMP